MAYTTASFSDVTYLDDFALPRQSYRPPLRGAIVIGLGIVAATGVVGAMAITSMMLAAPAANPQLAARGPAAPRPAVLAKSQDLPAPTLALSVPAQPTNDVTWADLISNPNPLANPSHFNLGQAVMARAEAAPPAAAVPVMAPLPPIMDRAEIAPEPAVANVPVMAPLPPVIARAEIAPPAANAPVMAPLPPVISRADMVPDQPALPEAAPLPRVMVHSEPVPLPPARPAGFAAREPVVSAYAPPPTVAPVEDARQAPARAKPRVTEIAKAAPSAAPQNAPQQDDRYPLQKFFGSLFGSAPSSSVPSLGGKAALYDIAAHTVYLPNGEKLEAHSGLGGMLDDPRTITAKNRGVTPPNVYQLSLRPQLFHGVAALRLTPVNESGMYGRDGMLAHTYMLGPRGDSNGCISFRDYQRFLRAFQRGEISRLVVVTHAGAAPYSVASNGR